MLGAAAISVVGVVRFRRTEPFGPDGTRRLRRHIASLHLAGAGLHSAVGNLLRFGRAMLHGGELDGVRILWRPFVDLATREVTIDGIGRGVWGLPLEFHDSVVNTVYGALRDASGSVTEWRTT